MDQLNLRSVMNANAAFSGFSGLLMAAFSNQVASFLGLSGGSGFILITGLGLMLFALVMMYFNRRPNLPSNYVLSIIVADALWVIASLVLLIGGWLSFSQAGAWAVGIVAAIVDVFATLQLLGWRRMGANERFEEAQGAV